MMPKSTHRSGGIILVLVMVSATAQMVSADAGSQTWYLSHTDDGSNKVMYKGSQDGGEWPVGIGTTRPLCPTCTNPVIWVANQSAECDVGFSPGDWNVHLRKWVPTPYTRSFNVSIGVWNENSLSFKSYGYVCDSFPNSRDVEFDIGASGFDVQQGEYLALRVENTDPSHTTLLGTIYTPFAIRTTDGYMMGEQGFKSYISSPSTDPGYPVPELPSLILVSAGLLMLVGYAYMGRRNK
ncbi:MAG: hypothetical protein U9N07_01215 [Euryarchaeota archaeon]|nr:hypothetical protein [Euryarchaeota archaeon]